MVVKPRTLKQDSVEFVTAVITDINGEDISLATYEVAHILDADKTDDPDTYPWEAPHAESESASPSVYLVRKLVTGTLVNNARTKYRVFVRITDNPEVIIMDCGTYTVLL